MPTARKPLVPHRLLLTFAPRVEPFTRPALVVAPHPDDESFGCGGVIAEKRRRGVPVKIVIVSDGSRSHGNQDAAATSALIARRREEARSACRELGVPAEDVSFLSLPDGELSALSADVRAAASERILALLQEVNAEEVYVTYRRDRHKDHEATFALTHAALQRFPRAVTLYEYPIWVCNTLHRWLQRVGLAAAVRARSVAIRPEALAQKRAAAQAHASQQETLPPDFADLFLTGRELYFCSEVAEKR